ncbi:MAG: hypothetical protein ACKO3B_07385, partial [Bacteroidota bacterium]
NAREHLHGFEFKGRMVRVEVTGSEDRPHADGGRKYPRNKKEGNFRSGYKDKGKPKKKGSGGDWFASKVKNWD